MVHVGAVLHGDFRQISVQAHAVDEILAALVSLADGVAAVMDAGGEPGAAELRERGRSVAAALRTRLERVQTLTAGRPRCRTVCLEWLDPFYCAGHWVPELVTLAGGEDPLGQPGADSVRVGWEEIVAARPEVLVALPCSFGLERAVAETGQLAARPGVSALPAAAAGRVWAVWAERYFSGSGPRVVDCVEILAGLLHPEVAAHLLPPGAAVRVDLLAQRQA